MKAETTTKGNKSGEGGGNILRRKKIFENVLIRKEKLDIISFLEKSCKPKSL